MNGRNVVVTGATGMVGGRIVEFALNHPDVGSVTTLGRRPTGVDHPRLHEIVHEDFADCRPLAPELTDVDAAFFCLGAYTGAVPDDVFRRITVDYAVAFAEALAAASPDAAFCLLSGAGADPSGTSRMAFARYKGEAEQALLRMGFSRVHLFRPGYIYPVEPRAEPNFAYRALRWAWPAVRLVAPNLGVVSDDLARVMLRVGLHGIPGSGDPVLENRDIRRLAEER